MKLNNPIFNSRLRTGGYSIDNVNNIVSLPAVPNATYPNVCGMGQSHSADLKISQSDAYTITRTSNVRLTSGSSVWVADRLVGQWAFAYVNATGLGSYIRVTANTATTVDTDGYFYAGCDRVKFSVWLPLSVISSHGESASSFIGNCFDGEYIWYAPYASSNFVKVNVATGEKIVVGAHGEGSNAFTGCCFDGESVWFAPYSASNFVKVNATTGIKTVIAAHGEGAGAFEGCCFDGESVWFSPWASANIVKVNVATGVKTTIAHGEVTNTFWGCCFDGESVWFSPYAASSIVKVNVFTNALTKIAHGDVANAYRGCCFDGESVWFSPFGSPNFTKINILNNSITYITHGYGSGAFINCCFDGESVWFAPWNSSNIAKVNVSTFTKTTIGAHGLGTNVFTGICFDGENIWYAPFASSNFVKTTIPRSGRASNYKPIVAGTGVFNNKVGIATTAPTAKLHIGAGTSTASTSPIKFTSGTNLSSPEPGAIEYDGYFSYTNNLAARNLLSTYTTTIPTGNSYTGKKGQYSADADYLYICYADNLWVRVAKTAW